MRALKVLVVVMGVALVAGAVALVAALVLRAERGGSATAAAAGSGSGSAEPLHAALPAGSRIVATELAGDRLVVRVALAGGGEAIYLFNARSGAAVAVIEAPANR
jgi:Family of unknown function (DUF6476)